MVTWRIIIHCSSSTIQFDKGWIGDIFEDTQGKDPSSATNFYESFYAEGDHGKCQAVYFGS
jgi:hypothetical protein